MSVRAIAAAVSAAATVGTMWLGTAAQAAPAVQLTGTQLASALLPASYFPAGYKVVKSTVYNSGPGLEHGPAKYHLATFSCRNYLVNGLPDTGFGESSSAGDAVNKGSQAYQQGVWQFASASQAASFYRQFYAFTWRCRSITATVGQDKATLTTQSLMKTQVGRHAAFRAVQTATLTGLPATMNNTIVTLAGTDVYAIDALGSKSPATPAVPAALLRLIARVQAAR
jgi:hypothetical protein